MKERKSVGAGNELRVEGSLTELQSIVTGIRPRIENSLGS